MHFLAVNPTTTTNVAAYTMQYASKALMAAGRCPSGFSYASRSDDGAWTADFATSHRGNTEFAHKPMAHVIFGSFKA